MDGARLKYKEKDIERRKKMHLQLKKIAKFVMLQRTTINYNKYD